VQFVLGEVIDPSAVGERSTDDRDLTVCCHVSLPSCVCSAGGEGAPSGSPVALLVLAYLSLL
jgi:MYXO-CTERM domain-containing protein